MKRFKILIIAVIIIITAIAYYQLDKQLSYYGRNNLHIYHLLPYNVEPDYQPPFEGGFALRQEDGSTGDSTALRGVWLQGAPDCRRCRKSDASARAAGSRMMGLVTVCIGTWPLGTVIAGAMSGPPGSLGALGA